MCREIARSEPFHVDIVARDVDDRRVFPLAEIQPARRVRENLAVEAHAKSNPLFVDVDSMLGILCVCAGKGHRDLLESESSQHSCEMRLKHVLFSA